MHLFPEGRELAEGIITFIKEKEGLNKKEEGFTSYRDRFGNLDETLKQIQETYPARVKEALEGISLNYNGFVDSAFAEFPLTVDAYWQGYRRTLGKSSLSIFEDKTKTLAENDKMFAEDYRRIIEIMAEVMETPKINFNIEPLYQLLDRQPKKFMGIGSYIFKSGDNGSPIETIWDLRQKDIPRLPSSEIK